MGFGGGIYTEQNKTLPGAYFKFKSSGTTVDTYANRGLVGLIAPSDWSDGGLTRLVVPELEFDSDGAMVWPRDAQKAIGYDAYASLPETYAGEADLAHWLPIFVRETFRGGATGCFIYPLLGTTKAKASCTYATAAKYGTRGNALSLKIALEDDETFTVYTLLDGAVVDEQNVEAYADLAANDWVVFDKAATLAEEAAVTFTGGANGTADATVVAAAVETMGSYGVNVIVPMIALTTSAGYDVFVLQNNKYGHWMQMICDHGASWLPDGGHEYCIGPDLGATNAQVPVRLLYPWLAGAEASCALGGTLDNKAYDGEIINFLINKKGLKAPSQDELEYGMRAGYMMLHTVGNEWRVLNDDNTFIAYTPKKDEAFHRNQTIRVLQTLANDWFGIFTNEFLGKAGTDESDRTNYKMRLVKSATYYQGQRAIKNFDSADIVVTEGAQSDSYAVQFYVQPNFCVRKVYHEITVAPFNS